MKRLVVFAVIITCVGCTSLRPIDGTPAELRQRINSGELLKAGDRVSIETSDLKIHEFVITAFSAGVIEGKRTSISVDQIILLDKRQYSRAKTWTLVAAVVLVVGGVAAFVAAHVAPVAAL
jgi:hypothetical protein